MKEESYTKLKLLPVIVGVLTILSIFLYLFIRTWLFLVADFDWPDKTAAFALLLAELFMIIHAIGYFINIVHVIVRGKNTEELTEKGGLLSEFPPVAIIVASYKEPLYVIEDTLVCFHNLTYPNKRLYFLDDTKYDAVDDKIDLVAYRKDVDDLCKRLEINVFRRKWRAAKAGIVNDFLGFIQGRTKEDFEFTPYSREDRREKEKYVIIFDADQNPFPDFVENLIGEMEDNPKLAFVQTPQYYTNFETNRVARASGLQQAVFYEFICEAKSLKRAMFCCGTNVMFRVEALEDIGGFDESSVTEDFATSFRFHERGWSSEYINKVCAFGLGPEDLGSYFKQQFRWALGTVGLLRTMIAQLFRNPGALSLYCWWEYLLSVTHYFVGWAFITMAVCPILYLIFGLPTYFVHSDFYFLFFSPYFVLSLVLFFWSLRSRAYKPWDIYVGLLLTPLSFPVYMKASALAVVGWKGTFQVTPKGESNSLPLGSLWAQVGLILGSVAAVTWGLHRLYYERIDVASVLLNSFWCLYFAVIMSTVVLYFNYPEKDSQCARLES